MALKFVIRNNKKERARVVLLRQIITQSKTDARVSGYKTLGALKGLDANSVEKMIIEKELTEPEQFDLENHVAQLNFNQHDLKDSIEEEFHREIVYWSKSYQSALYRLWQLSKAHNIAFCPLEIMQKSLLTKAKTVERKLNEIMKEPVNVLESIGIDISPFNNEELTKRVHKTCRKLFKLLLKTYLSEEALSVAFNEAAKAYTQKKEPLKAYYIKDYATNTRKLPFWYNAVLIDLLIASEINPLQSFTVEEIAEDWIRFKKDKITEEEAFIKFMTLFNPKKEDETRIKSVITAHYRQGVVLPSVKEQSE